MDRISDSDSEDAGSIPAGATKPPPHVCQEGHSEGVFFLSRKQSVNLGRP
jgi:hypothetical protein